MKEPISITAIASISPLGSGLKDAWLGYQNEAPVFDKMKFGDTLAWAAALPIAVKMEVDQLKATDFKYKNLDDTVRYAILASRNALAMAGWKSGEHFGVNMGSSRGATALFEKYHEEFLLRGKASTLTSPTTTLGNISSWVAHDLQTNGPEISNSITCSTALHGMLNGVAWIRSGMADKFLVGGSEAPLTPFTVAQMKALKIYAALDQVGAVNDSPDQVASKMPLRHTNISYPCRALDLHKNYNSMVLGEGAAVACLEKGVSNKSLAILEGIGYATEPLEHMISISTDAKCFQRSMKMALGDGSPEEVDVIVMHAPGTIQGDLSEFKAIEKVFGEKVPALTTNKWKMGHTFGASGMMSVEMAILMMRHQQFIKVPYLMYDAIPSKINKVMVNAVGFGGNAVSILLKIPSR